MEQTKNRWVLKVVLAAVFAFAMTLAFVFGLLPGTTLTAHAEDDPVYYLVGTMNNWTKSDEYVLTKNVDASTEEYFIDIDFLNIELNGATGAQFKVVSDQDVSYPSEENSDYSVSENGRYRVSFRPNGDGGDGWHYNVLYVERKPNTYHKGTVNLSELRSGDILDADEGLIYILVDENWGWDRWIFRWVDTGNDNATSAPQEYSKGQKVEIPYGYRYTMDLYGVGPSVPDMIMGREEGYWYFSDDCVVRYKSGVVTVSLKPEGVEGGPGDGTMYDYSLDDPAEYAGIRGQAKKIVFEEGVTSVGDYSFRNFSAAKEIVFSSTIRSIGKSAFTGCGVGTLSIPASVTSIGEGAFESCSSITSLVWPEGVKSLGNGVFRGCSGLVDVRMPDSVTSMGIGIFANCSNLETVYLSNSITNITTGVFDGCSKLTEITIGASVTHIDHTAFAGFGSSTKFYFVVPSEPHDITIENGFSSGGGHAFSSDAVPYFKYEEGVSDPDINLYFRASQVVDGQSGALHIDAALSKTYNWANKYRIITYYSGDCEEVLSYDGKLTVRPRTDGGEGNDGSGKMGDCPEYTVNEVRYISFLPITSIVIEDGVTEIGTYAFYQCVDTVTVTIGKDVKRIGEGAFDACTALRTVSAPEGLNELEALDTSAFYSCVALQTFPSLALTKLTAIGAQVFEKCSSLQEIILPAGIQSIGAFAFSECSSLKMLIIPKAVTTIGQSAFTSPVILERPDAEVDLQPYEFGYISVASFIGPDDIKLFNDSTGDEVKEGDAFKGLCHWRKSHDYESGDCIVNVWGSVITIRKKADGNGTGVMADYAAVEDCPWLFRAMEYRKVIVEEGVTHIGNKSFLDCKHINSVTLPEGLTSIGADVFKNILDLPTMTIPSTVEWIGDHAFENYTYNLYFVRPELNSDCRTLTLGEEAIQQALQYANPGLMYLCLGRDMLKEEVQPEGNKTYTWRPYQYEVRVTSDDYNVTASIGEESPIYYASAGEQVVLTIDGEVPSFYIRKRITSVQDVVDMVGNRVIEKDNGVVKVVDGKLVLLIDGNVVATLTDDYTVSFENNSYHPSTLDDSSENYFFKCAGKNTWFFRIINDSLDRISVSDDEGEVFSSYERLGIGFLRESMLELTDLGDGKYTFTMPDRSIRIGGNVIQSVEITIPDLVPGATLPVATTETPNVTLSSIIWDPSPSNGKVDYDTQYIADFAVITAKGFSYTTNPYVTVNGQTVTGTMLEPQGGRVAYRITFTFKTEPNPISPATVTTAPKAKDLNANGMAQELIVAGEAENGTMQYAFGVNDTQEPLSGWSENIPVGVNAAQYFVWYKAVGDAEHSDSKAGCVISYIFFEQLETGAYSHLIAKKDYSKTDEENLADLSKKIVNFNGYQWYLIEDYSTGANEGTVTLFLANTVLGSTYFSNTMVNHIVITAYADSNLKSVLDALTASGGSFASVAGAIADTDIVDVCVTSAKLYPISEYEKFGIEWITEAENLERWWLRTEGDDPGESMSSYSRRDDPTESYGVRPALRLDLSKVTFDSATNTFEVIHDHNADILEYVEAKEPTTCTDGNIAYYRCIVCGECFADENGNNPITYESTIIPNLGHVLVYHEGKEPTCTEGGWAPYDTCSNCDHTTYQELPALGHRWSKWVDNGEGMEIRTCRVCGEKENRQSVTSFVETIETNKEQSEYRGDFTVITVDNTGDESGTCLYDDEKMSVYTSGREIAKAIFYLNSNSYWACDYVSADKGNITIAPDSSYIIVENIHSELVVFMSSQPTYIQSVAVYLISPDDITKVDAIAPTCTEAGNIDYWYDAYNDLYYSDENGETIIELTDTVIPTLGHDWGEWVIVKEATVDEEGLERRVCTRDENHYEERTIPKVDPHIHNYEFVEFVWTEYTAKAKYVCTEDNNHVELHDAVITSEVTTAATCEGKGVRTYTATYDGHTDTKTEEIEALGHNYEFVEFVWTEYTAQAKYICSRDNTHVELYDAVITSELTKATTCTETGIRTYTATYEGHIDTKTEIIGALNHNYVFDSFVWDGFTAQAKYVCSHDNNHVELHDAVITSEVTTAATCEGKGVRAYTATYEGHTATKTEEIEALGHKPSEAGRENEVAATCETAGSYDEVVYCSVCNKEIARETKIIEALGHNYEFVEFVWTEYTAKAKYVCSHDETHFMLYDATVTSELTKAATCTETGTRTYKATYEGQSATKTEEIKALGHNYEFVEFVWTEYTAQVKYICSRDNTHVELHDATVTNEVTTAATCEGKGVRTYIATYDGHTGTKIETIDELGHDWGEWIIISEPTNEEEGLERRVCSHDETHVEERAIPVHSHNETTLEFVAAKDSTCTEVGNIAYYVCKECGKYFADVNGQKLLTAESIVTPALGHDYQAVVTAPTCTERGYTTHTCSHCNDSYIDAYVDALGHDYQDIVTAPTCTERGFTTHTCSRCGDSFIDTYVDALGHNFGEWVVIKEAQVGVKGEEAHTCSLCGETETREIAALPYVPTTNDDGEKVYSETLTEEAKDVTELFAQAKEEEGTVEIKTGDIIIVFDKDAVNAIGNSNVSISAQVSTENLTVENAELVIEVTLMGATFADGSATVTIPFNEVVPAGKVAKVYYIADDGTRTDMHATFAEGKATFVTNHFSIYSIVFEDAAIANGGLSAGAIVGIVLGVVALLALGGFALIWFVIKKKTWADLLVLFKKK